MKNHIKVITRPLWESCRNLTLLPALLCLPGPVVWEGDWWRLFFLRSSLSLSHAGQTSMCRRRCTHLSNRLGRDKHVPQRVKSLQIQFTAQTLEQLVSLSGLSLFKVWEINRNTLQWHSMMLPARCGPSVVNSNLLLALLCCPTHLAALEAAHEMTWRSCLMGNVGLNTFVEYFVEL